MRSEQTQPFQERDLEQALQVLQRGGVILYPTDTVWGLGCDATNTAAVQRIHELKGRTDPKSMLVLMEDPGFLHRYVAEIPDVTWDLIECSDRPLTLVFPGARNLAGNLLAVDGSIGIRFTREMFTKTLIRRLKKPLVSTSANLSGEPAPCCFRDIDSRITIAVDYVVRYRQEETLPGKPSSILKLGAGGLIEIIRK